MKHFGDITKIDGHAVPIVDIITGGSPCQDLSVAGKRAGLAGERSGLFMEQVRIIREMRENDRANKGADVDFRFLRPRYMVWENVPGAFTSNNGEDFRAVLEETAKIADKNARIPGPPGGKWPHAGAILGDGWSIAWRLHDAQFWGVPQRRKRVALVADFGGSTATEILFDRESLPGDSETGGAQEQTAAGDFTGGVGETGQRNLTFSQDAYDKYTENEKSATIKQSGGVYGGGSETLVISLTTEITPKVDEGGVAFTLRNRDFKDPQSVCTYVLENHPEDSRVRIAEDGIVQTLSGRMGTGGGNVPMMMEERMESYYIVRRLTPLECERLQGFPDGWTDLGEWTDSKGKVHKGESDSPRYKALGNSIALPFWEWMAKRMRKYLGDDPTMASLFDGIGGFPLAYQRAGVRPVWASEIEEFPIAVTKKRFPD